MSKNERVLVHWAEDNQEDDLRDDFQVSNNSEP